MVWSRVIGLRLLAGWTLALVMLNWAGPIVADCVVTPGSYGMANLAPFGYIGNIRYQQIYSASLFGNVGPIQITSLQFSPDSTIIWSASVNISLNQTTASIDALSTNLDSNVTGSLTDVFQNSAFSQDISSSMLTFNLAPFVYNPSTGENLLMDVTVDDIPGGNRQSAFWRVGDTGFTSRAYSANGLTGGGHRYCRLARLHLATTDRKLTTASVSHSARPARN